VSTARVIVNSALRKLGRLAAGREARLADAQDTLEALRGLYSSWIAGGACGRLRDVVPTGTNYTTPGNERIYRTGPDPLSVTLPELVSEGWRDDFGHERHGGNFGTIITISQIGDEVTVVVEAAQPIGHCVVTPRDMSAVVISDEVGGQTQSWLYDGNIKKWQSIDNLTLDDDAPRSSADPEGLAALLALEMADKFGIDISPFTMRAANRFNTALSMRLGMRRESTYQPEAYF